jgi:hypothetical protein
MLAIHSSNSGEPEAQRPDPQAIERGLHSSRYSALKHVSCNYEGGVLVLRGRLPTYYLKQVAQEVVTHEVKEVGRLENRIRVVRTAPGRRRG